MYTSCLSPPPPRWGGVLTTWCIPTCACLLGYFFRNFVILIGWVFIQDKGAKMSMSVFWKKCARKHSIFEGKIGCFSGKLVYWWVLKCAKTSTEIVRILRCGRLIHVQNVLKIPPAPVMSMYVAWQAMNMKHFNVFSQCIFNDLTTTSKNLSKVGSDINTIYWLLLIDAHLFCGSACKLGGIKFMLKF